MIPLMLSLCFTSFYHNSLSCKAIASYMTENKSFLQNLASFYFSKLMVETPEQFVKPVQQRH